MLATWPKYTQPPTYLNAGNVFQHNICDSGKDDDRAGHVLPRVVSHDDAANEDVDCCPLLSVPVVYSILHLLLLTNSTADE